MTPERTQPPTSAFSALQRFVRRPAAGERCELCGTAVAAEHEHLLETSNRRLACACQACAILFSASQGQVSRPGGHTYKRVPSRFLSLPDFRMTGAQWESLLVPINMAFFFESSTAAKVMAVYPSPAGATESLLPLETWGQIVADNPELESMEPDVEALLVNRLAAGRAHQYFLLPIDQCFKLVGLVRLNWRGLSGGAEMWQALDQFFSTLTAHADVAAENRHA